MRPLHKREPRPLAGETKPDGLLNLVVLRPWPANPSFREILRHGLPRRGLAPGVAAWRLRNLPNLWRGCWRLALVRLFRINHAYGTLYLEVPHGNGQRTQLGLASLRVVTTAGVNYLRDCFLNTKEPENMKFHGFGTGSTAEAVGDTTLVTELTTQYATDNTRPTGSQVSGGIGAYQTVATLTPDADVAITEHGIFDQASNAGGTLLDRSKFAAINLVAANPDSLQATYTFTMTAGG